MLISSFEEFNCNFDFAILKVGFTDYDIKKTKYKINNFDDNYMYAKENGIDIGVFYESRATSIIEAKEELEFYFDIIKNKKFEYPICMKVMDDHNTIIYHPKSQKTIDKKELLNIIKYMYNNILKYGYNPLIITYKDITVDNYSIIGIDNDIIYIDTNKEKNLLINVNKNCFFDKIYIIIKKCCKTIRRKVRKK